MTSQLFRRRFNYMALALIACSFGCGKPDLTSDSQKPMHLTIARPDHPEFFELRSVDVWGDYGDILINGDIDEPKRIDGHLTTSRTGPFVPPIAFVREMIVTGDFKERLRERFPYLQFKEVVKCKIVEIHWENWDRKQDPEIYPPGGEPENYLFELPHSPEAAAKLGALWEVIIPEGARSRLIEKDPIYTSDTAVDAFSWTGHDLFTVIPVPPVPIIVVSDAGKEWFEKEVGEWVSFKKYITE